MSPPISLCILWHQHQPYYPDDVTGENLFPWVRLHGTKDYYGMALHLLEVPEFRCTINLVPSLVTQLLKYVEGDGSDRLLDLAKIPADSLSEGEAIEVLDQFFMANRERMIAPYPRYAELHARRDAEQKSARDVLGDFDASALRDLQVWHNLTWMHPLVFERDPDLKALRDRGRDFTEDEKHFVLKRQREILKDVLPLHKELSDRGQVELTTTPFYHPILPLLWDKTSAREAMPDCELPTHLESYAEDAREHLRRGVEFHERHFGQRPHGMWPSEGSVSQAVIRAIADEGIRWIATDEEVLFRSMGEHVSRDEQGRISRPDLLYRPWRVRDGDAELDIVFRDHRLSDLIGFHYQWSDPVAAAHDLLRQVEEIGRQAQPGCGDRSVLVPIILDGENCWEYYPDGGVPFLRTLYHEAVKHPDIRPLRMRDALEAHPPTDHITRLSAGSWINHNFAIWIGHSEDNAGWDRLHEAREFLLERQQRGSVDPDALAKAWEELYIAEGSDWFWWYGDDHSSEQDALFDEAFRRHLKHVYTLLGAEPPGRLDHPISRSAKPPLHTVPRDFLSVRIDGYASYFEWQAAGLHVPGSERSTMTMVSDSLLTGVRFGFGRNSEGGTRFLLRLDTEEDAIATFTRTPNLILDITTITPAETTFTLRNFDGNGIDIDGGSAAVRSAIGQVLEVSIPIGDLDATPGDSLRFHLALRTPERTLERLPAEAGITLTVPTEDAYAADWQA